MAKFEEMMEKMENMAQEEMQKQIQEVKKVCKDYCGKCPTYKGTGETEFGFCATGKADKITEEKKCLCAQCPITEKMGLRWEFYCTRGSGQEQAEK